MKAVGRAGAAGAHRVFVALWPTPDVRARLDQVAAEVAAGAPRARRIDAANLHLTLAFIGSLAAERVAQLARCLAAAEALRFDWVIDRVGHFARARVVWAGGPGNAALVTLATETRALLDRLRIDYDRKPFAPHVTLLRDADRRSVDDQPIAPPIVWPCRGAVLVRSQQASKGVMYTPIKCS